MLCYVVGLHDSFLVIKAVTFVRIYRVAMDSVYK
jgi:hypothetical protein